MSTSRHDRTANGQCAAIRVAFACLLFVAWGIGPAAVHAQSFCIAPNPSYTLGSSLPGASPGHEFTFDVYSGELQISQALLIYPADFTFNGFASQPDRPANAQIGAMFFDMGPNGTEEASAPIRAIGEHYAYVDLNNSGVRHFLEPTLSHAVAVDGSHQFRLINYFGGDREPGTTETPLSSRRRLVLNPGIFTNPYTTGFYTLSGIFISVNWETGDAPQTGETSFLTCPIDYLEVEIQEVANQPPVADAGPDQLSVEATSPAGASVTLDGSGSSDPDGNPLSYVWSENAATITTGVNPAVTLSLGSHVITLIVDDGNGASDSDTVTINVVDTTPPSITAPADVTADCAGTGGTAVSLGTPSVSDIATLAADIVVTNNAPGLFPVGATTVTWTATDGAGNQNTAQQTVTVADTIPPDLSVSVTPDMLWPPNHKMYEVMPVVSATDACDASPTIQLVNITMNEGDEELAFDPLYDTTLGDGNTTNDIQYDSSTGQVFVRAERSGTGSGRVYTLTYQATDAAGNTAQATATVTVPHSQ
jgi:hypothetical protein